MITKIGVAGWLSAAGFSALVWVQAANVPTALAKTQTVTPAPTAAMLPDRILECQLGRITNFAPDNVPDKPQLEGSHFMKLFLPAIPVRTTEPPLSTLPPEPVDPRTRILADPDGITAGAAMRKFERVVDYWPERVELTTPIGGGYVNLIILQPSEGQPGLTDMFMARAKDAVTYDKDHMYSGRCAARLGDAADPAAR